MGSCSNFLWSSTHNAYPFLDEKFRRCAQVTHFRQIQIKTIKFSIKRKKYLSEAAKVVAKGPLTFRCKELIQIGLDNWYLLKRKMTTGLPFEP